MHLKTSTNLSSIGLGVDAAIGRHAILSVTGASLLQSSGPIHAGDWKAEAAINVRF
jgi:hypothetical protein